MIKYDADYYYNLLRIHTDTARMICERRWKFIEENLSGEKQFIEMILDYGCGIGFMKAFVPEWVQHIDTYDPMSVPQTGITSNRYDLIMLYDVLEHIADFTEITSLLENAKYVVITVPIKPDGVPWGAYKHFKPGEHLHYFSHDLIEHMFHEVGFDLAVADQPECPPREDVWTFLFKKKES